VADVNIVGQNKVVYRKYRILPKHVEIFFYKKLHVIADWSFETVGISVYAMC
jgi:hypothetical protein